MDWSTEYRMTAVRDVRPGTHVFLDAFRKDRQIQCVLLSISSKIPSSEGGQNRLSVSIPLPL